ncbi:MAG TPA: hypothetical protein VIS75_14365, partial [Chitinophagaceae bacterium]
MCFSFVLSFAQAKERTYVVGVLLSFLCHDTKKRNKRKIEDKRMAQPVCPASAHEESLYFVI